MNTHTWCIILILLVFVTFIQNNKPYNNIPYSHTTTRKKPLTFIHIPKNAGTTIEDIGMAHNVKWGKVLLESDSKIANIHNINNWHIPPRFFKSYNPYTPFDTFCVIRNPVSRILSEYKYVFRHDITKDNPTDLNNWLQQNLNAKNIYEVGGRDGHLFPQYFFMYDEHGNPTCTYMLNMNNLENEFNFLMRMYDYPMRMTDNHISNRTYFSVSESDISTPNLQKIYDFYEIDFSLYNSINQHT